jgi:formate dehydrogenase beta subunit
MGKVAIKLDGTECRVEEGASILEAALGAEVYVPNLCYHPDLPTFEALRPGGPIFQGQERIESESDTACFEGCRLCLVEVQGEQGLVTACNTTVADGMEIRTDTPRIVEARREQLSRIFARHPHACIGCAQRFGCALEPCSTNVPQDERCCSAFGKCELQKVAEFVGIKGDTPRYTPPGRPVLEDEPLFRMDYNLCIGCGRCVRACVDLRGVRALGCAWRDGRLEVGTVAPTLKESGCKFCGACVEVCPTGALMDKATISGDRESVLVPCRDTCPAGMDVPAYIRLIAQGDFTEAAAVVRESVPLPGVLGRVCYHPCEERCRRAEVDEPVAICALKMFAAGWGESRAEQSAQAEASGKRVAVVGSGPAGLTAAYFLALKGHEVTVLEAAPKPGGMLRYGIPQYRLPEAELDREISEIERLGVTVKTSAAVGGDVNLSSLLDDGYDAVLLAVGKQRSFALDVDGEGMKGVESGLDFLRRIRSGDEPAIADPVVVIGGGNVAIDVARSARRLGAGDVKICCLESREEMPAHDSELEEALEEGIGLFPSLGPKRILGGEGKVTGIELMRCTSVFDEGGRFAPAYDTEDTSTLEAGTVIVAIGQGVDFGMLSREMMRQISERGVFQTRGEEGHTAISKLFACGDSAGDSVNVIEAAASARRAVSAIDKFLGGDGDFAKGFPASGDPGAWLGRDEDFAARERSRQSHSPAAERVRDFQPIFEPLGEQAAIDEAGRCLRCDLRLKIASVVLPPEKWLEFNAEQIESLPDTAGVYQLADEELKVVAIQGVANLRSSLIETLESTAGIKAFSWEENPMFTKRESELIQQHLRQFGKLPGMGGDDLDDLF